MDPRILRDTGELSDFTVYVEKDRFKLHKFPLYTKSEYFKDLAASNHVCELANFPGGSKMFSLIADHCYDKDIDINMYNVAFIFACAEFLRMKGRNNLLDICRSRINDICADAKDKGCFAPLVILLCCMNEVKDNTSSTTFTDTLDVIRTIWQNEKRQTSEDSTVMVEKGTELYGDNRAQNKLVEDFLVYLPLDVAVQLINSSGFGCESAYDFISKYLGRILDHHLVSDKRRATINHNGANSSQKPAACESTTTPRVQQSVPEKICQPASLASVGDQLLLEKFHKNNPLLRDNLSKPVEHFESIFDLIPEVNTLHEHVSPEWAKQALILVYNSEPKPRCYQKILKLAHKMLLKLSTVDVSDLPSPLMRDLVAAFDPVPRRTRQSGTISPLRKASNLPSGAGTPSELHEADDEESNIAPKGSLVSEEEEVTDIDSQQTLAPLPTEMTMFMLQYMNKKAEEGSLTEDEFLDLFQKLDLSLADKKSQDILLTILLKLHEAGRSLNEQQMEKVLSRIDLSTCSVDALERALESDTLPPKPIAQAVIKAIRECPSVYPEAPATQTVPTKPSMHVDPATSNGKSKPKRLYGMHVASDNTVQSWNRPSMCGLSGGYSNMFAYSMSPAQGMRRPSSKISRDTV
ncbi:unnamed protein product [Dicrocoelium dendriticum]|nr:unnamed protein product [Dicrocoelium dendriticum]